MVILLSMRTIFPRRFNRNIDWRGWHRWLPWWWWRRVNWGCGCPWWRVNWYWLPILCSSTIRPRPSPSVANEEPLRLCFVIFFRGGSHADPEQAIYKAKNSLRFVSALSMTAWPFRTRRWSNRVMLHMSGTYLCRCCITFMEIWVM